MIYINSISPGISNTVARLVLGLLSQVRINQSQHHDQKKIKSNSYFLAHDATLISNNRLMVENPESGPPFPLQHLPRHLRDHHGLQQLLPGIPIIFLADHQLMLSLLILKFFITDLFLGDSMTFFSGCFLSIFMVDHDICRCRI